MPQKEANGSAEDCHDLDGDGELNEDEKTTLSEALPQAVKRVMHVSLPNMMLMVTVRSARKKKPQSKRVRKKTEKHAPLSMKKKKAAIIEAFDADGDGELNEDERAPAKAAHKETVRLASMISRRLRYQ